MTQSPSLHPRNKHNGDKGQRYDLPKLCLVNPVLEKLVVEAHGKPTLDFSDPTTVKELNKALLLKDYKIEFWDLPEQFLCPPVPGRVDYIHYLADLLANDFDGDIPTGKNVVGLDIGTGANLIYPIVGSAEYGWKFVGSDIDPVSLKCAEQLCKFNKRLTKQIKLKQQKQPKHIFEGVIQPADKFMFSMCNPPFHRSEQEANKGSQRKNRNLKSENTNKLNFAGRNNELWCDGGERQFVTNMIRESQQFQTQVLWFTSLIAKNDNLKALYAELDKVKPVEVKTVEMTQGNKQTRFIAWSFLNKTQRQAWFE